MKNYDMIQVNRIIILLWSLIIISCSESTKKEGIVISGKIQNASGEKVVFRELDVDSFRDLDSATLDDFGFFRFICDPSDAGFRNLENADLCHVDTFRQKYRGICEKWALPDRPSSSLFN